MRQVIGGATVRPTEQEVPEDEAGYTKDRGAGADPPELAKAVESTTTLSHAAPSCNVLGPPPTAAKEPENLFSLTRIKDMASTVQSLFTVAAIIVGGYWFLKQEQAFPRGNITHAVSDVVLDNRWRLIRLTVTFQNSGQIPINLSDGHAYIERIAPVDPSIAEQLGRADVQITKGTTTIPWPRIGDIYKFHPDAKLEPQESETYDFDFVIPAWVCEVALVSFVANAEYKNLGWERSTIFKVEDCHHDSQTNALPGTPAHIDEHVAGKH